MLKSEPIDINHYRSPPICTFAESGHKLKKSAMAGEAVPHTNTQLIDTLEHELSNINHENCPTICAFVDSELFRLRGGIVDFIDVVSGKKIKIRAKISIAQDAGPGINHVGRLLGPGGQTLKSLQSTTMTKMAILGQGSMRNNDKELECLASGDPKYQHLKHSLHLQIDSLAEPSEAYYRMSHALAEVKKVLGELPAHTPDMNASWNQPAPANSYGVPYGTPPPQRGGGPPRGRGRGNGVPPPVHEQDMYSAGGYDLPPDGFGSAYGQYPSMGKAPPSRGFGAPRGARGGGRPYPRGGRGGSSYA